MQRMMFPCRDDEADAAVLSDASVEHRLQRVCSNDHSHEVVYRTLYSVHQRAAQRNPCRRALLAGDAAHLNNRPGGMGMNGGMHDAFSLSAKLARVLCNGAGESVLDEYEHERRAVRSSESMDR